MREVKQPAQKAQSLKGEQPASGPVLTFHALNYNSYYAIRPPSGQKNIYFLNVPVQLWHPLLPSKSSSDSISLPCLLRNLRI